MAAKRRKARSLDLSPEVEWYLESRGYGLPKCLPKFHTPEPRNVKGAVFDADEVDRKIRALSFIRHTQGRWAGQPIIPTAEQVAYLIAPVFGWLAPNPDTGRLVRIIRDAYFEMPRKGAKALALDTPLLTPEGWTTMGEIQPGQYVYSPDGNPVRVTHVSEVFTGTPCYRVSTQDGRAVVASGDHLWTVHTSDWRRDPWRTLTTEDLAQRGVTRGPRSENVYRLPPVSAIAAPERALPVDPYHLGYWLGDGNTRDGRITVGVEDIEFARVALAPIGYERFDSRGSGSRYTLRPEGLHTKLRAAGLLGRKRIPDAYLTASVAQRLDLLRGLMDSDGTVDLRGRAAFGGCDQGLVQDAQTLARTLGYRPGPIQVSPAKIDGRTVGSSYRFQFRVSSGDLVPFRLPRKAERCGLSSSDDRRHTLTLASIEPVLSVPTRCIKVDSEEGLFLAGRGLIPTHNTTIASAFGTLLAFADGEGGAQVLFGAASKDQARRAFQPIKAVVEASPVFAAAGVRALRTEIVQPSTSSYIQVISSDGDLAHGANVHGALVDELHVHKNGDLLDALESGTGAREQPLVIIITTADDGKTNTPYSRKREMIEKLSNGVLNNPAQYGVVFAADDDADPFSEETWAQANPLYPVTPSRTFMRAAANKARANPVELAKFLRLHLGIRSKLASGYFDMVKWDRNRGNSWGDLAELSEALKVPTAYGGLDLASVSDVTCLGWLIRDPGKPGYDVVLRSFIPEAALPALDATTDKNASAWVKAGWLTLTPGDVTDYDFIKDQVEKDAALLDVVGIGFDRWNSSQLVIDLQDAGLPLERVGQGYASMSAPLKELDRLVRRGTSKTPLLRHAGNPVLKWMADNLRPSSDPAGNVKPDKARSTNKIDGISALTMAMFVALSQEGETHESAYENGAGVETV